MSLQKKDTKKEDELALVSIRQMAQVKRLFSIKPGKEYSVNPAKLN